MTQIFDNVLWKGSRSEGTEIWHACLLEMLDWLGLKTTT